MKKTRICTLLALLLMAGGVTMQAQTKIGFGLQKELFGVPLNPENASEATFNVDKVDIAVLLNDHFRIGLGFQPGTLVNHQEKRYETSAGLSLSLAYLFTFKDYKDFAMAPTLSVGNSFKDFTSFKNMDVDLGVRSYLFKSMYLGTGVRYAQWKNSDILDDHSCFSWYWEMGFDLYLKR